MTHAKFSVMILGKYICDGDFDSKYRYAAPPGPSAC